MLVTWHADILCESNAVIDALSRSCSRGLDHVQFINDRTQACKAVGGGKIGHRQCVTCRIYNANRLEFD
jgi:hypothetical protein